MSASATDRKKPATYADLEAVPEHLVAEIIDGVLRTHPRPSRRHVAAASSLGDELVGPFQKGRGGPGGWLILDEPEIHLRDDVVVPDLAGWRRDRLVDHPETNFFTVAPDWICEVLSGSTERRDRTVKRKIYARHGVSFLWLVDPRQQMLEAFALVDGAWVLRGTWNSDDEVRAPPFDAIAFSLADLWPFDPPLGMNEDPTPYYAGDR
ncbi:Uma2 family endonuclease [Aquibium microcysteis]|uniref:Uma2 family endonuclease n=1 Tax=Aquibium microcysteis TaxID=675281 RepID=UPI00165D04BE|nr:Uma2 family endonuclease [Aquibium microcysteis]